MKKTNPKKKWSGEMLHIFNSNRFFEIGERLGVDPKVVSTHTSKSITLPVVQYLVDGTSLTLRDNFHDINLLVQAVSALNIPLRDIYPEQNWIWYQEQIKRKREYCYKGWTDEEMDDPRILRVKVNFNNREPIWRNIRADAKDRWIARNESTEWYGKDWSSGFLLIDSPINKTTKFYVASHPHAEGMDKIVNGLTERRDSNSDLLYTLSNQRNFLIDTNTWENTNSTIDVVIMATKTNRKR